MEQTQHPKLRVLERGKTKLSKYREVIILAGAEVLITTVLSSLLPERLLWGKSEHGNDAPSDAPAVAPVSPTPTAPPATETGLQQLVAQEAGITADMSFDQAFARARRVLGSGKVFAWHGKLYNTFYKEEWQSMSSQQHEAFLGSIVWTQVPADEAPNLEPVVPIAAEIVQIIGDDVLPEQVEVDLPTDSMEYELNLDNNPNTTEGVGVDTNNDNILDEIHTDTGDSMYDTDHTPGLDVLGHINPDTSAFEVAEVFNPPVVITTHDDMVLFGNEVHEINITPDDVNSYLDSTDFNNHADVHQFD